MNHNAAQYHPNDCGGLDNQCCQCTIDACEEERDTYKSQLAAEREKVKAAEQSWKGLDMQYAELAQSYKDALAAQKAAEERAVVAAELLSTARDDSDCTCANCIAIDGAIAALKFPAKPTQADKERWAAFADSVAPQAPAAPEGSGK